MLNLKTVCLPTSLEADTVLKDALNDPSKNSFNQRCHPLAGQAQTNSQRYTLAKPIN